MPRATGGPVDASEARRFLDGLGSGGAVMVKAVAGGGGRGMRPVARPGGLDDAVRRCAAEAAAAFGNAAVYAEELHTGARHIEVQVAADGTGVAVLGDRDCSVQRRRQKLIEIAPAPSATTCARGCTPPRGCSSARPRTAGWRPSSSSCSGREIMFLEVNPRIQVEHTVTEEVTGLDLVALALRLADGATAGRRAGRLDGLPGRPQPAASPSRPGSTPRPSARRLRAAGQRHAGPLPAAGGRGVRVDTHGYPGYQVSPRYDSLLAKVIASGATDARPRRLRRALGEFDVDGVPVNRGLLRALADLSLRAGLIDTAWLDPHPGLLPPAAPTHRRSTPAACRRVAAVRAPMPGVVVAVAAQRRRPGRAGAR